MEIIWFSRVKQVVSQQGVAVFRVYVNLNFSHWYVSTFNKGSIVADDWFILHVQCTTTRVVGKCFLGFGCQRGLKFMFQVWRTNMSRTMLFKCSVWLYVPFRCLFPITTVDGNECVLYNLGKSLSKCSVLYNFVYQFHQTIKERKKDRHIFMFSTIKLYNVSIYHYHIYYKQVVLVHSGK